MSAGMELPHSSPASSGSTNSGFGVGAVGIDASEHSAVERRPSRRMLSMESARLVVVDGAATGERFPLDKVRILVGRSNAVEAGADLDLTHQQPGGKTSVSRLHAEVNWDGGRLWLQDLGSLNGTFVNDAQLPPPQSAAPSARHELHAGDVIRFGDVSLRLEPR